MNKRPYIRCIKEPFCGLSHGAGIVLSVVALIVFSLPYKLGLILAALVGILVGTVLEGRKSSGGTS